MKAVIQRVASASVTVDSHLVSTIGKGVLVFAGVSDKDSRKEVEAMASKVLKMKMWPDESGGTWKQNVQDINGEVLCVSQFTLQASTKKGNKPDFHGAAGSEQARELYDVFYGKVQELYDPAKVKNVNSQNSGPVSVDYSSLDGAVTLEIDTNPSKGATESKGREGTESKASGEPTPSKTFQMPSELLE